ncbi:Spy/CpxP family protein refolding chaperone [Undibacterium sp. RuRC25W]|uniref:Spy/CpxP family protein refolding chaperone n=1 Tax=Undibacterium sp. RuRC25W TaxID=3413047 RepID=UPI003BF392A3
MTSKTIISRLLATIAMSFAITSGTVGNAFAADSSPQPMQQEWMKHHQEMRAEHLKKLATHLGITAAQDKAWQDYTAVLTATPTQMKHPDVNADAASIARFHADLAAEHAKRLATLADATSQLQASLTPEQRKKFDDIAHHMMAMHQQHHHHGWHHTEQHHGNNDAHQDVPAK